MISWENFCDEIQYDPEPRAALPPPTDRTTLTVRPAQEMSNHALSKYIRSRSDAPYLIPDDAAVARRFVGCGSAAFLIHANQGNPHAKYLAAQSLSRASCTCGKKARVESRPERGMRPD